MTGFPVYVTGMMESGKSTLMSLLDGHPDLLVYPEEPQYGRMLEALYATAQQAGGFLDLSPLSRDGRLRGVEDRQDTVFDRKKYSKALRTALAEDFSPTSIMIATMRAFAEATAQDFGPGKMWVFNEPNRARLAPWLFSTFPGAKVIHLVRDPREHFRAIKAHHARSGLSLGRWPARNFAMNWSLAVCQALDNQKRFGENRYLVLRYEDICTDRETAMRRVALFLGVEFVPSLLRPTKVGLAAKRAEGADTDQTCMQSLEETRIVDSEIGKWFEDLPWRQSFLIESCCAEEMSREDLSYAVNSPTMARNILRFLVTRYVHAAYYSSRLLKGLLAPAPLHELCRIDRAASNTQFFRL